jgi:hypothetical protein
MIFLGANQRIFLIMRTQKCKIKELFKNKGIYRRKSLLKMINSLKNIMEKKCRNLREQRSFRETRIFHMSSIEVRTTILFLKEFIIFLNRTTQ